MCIGCGRYNLFIGTLGYQSTGKTDRSWFSRKAARLKYCYQVLSLKKKNVFLETLLFLGEKEDKSRFLEKVLFKSKVGIFTPNSDSNILYPVVLKKLFGVRYQFGHHFHFGQKPS